MYDSCADAAVRLVESLGPSAGASIVSSLEGSAIDANKKWKPLFNETPDETTSGLRSGIGTLSQ